MEGLSMTRRNWINILLLGGGFFLVFTAFQTSAFVQSVTIDSFLSPTCNNGTIVNPDEPKNKHYIKDGGIPITEDFSKRIGYISLCIIYLMVALGNWVSVPIVTVFGAKWACVISAALYVVYIVALIRPYVPVIFLGAFVLGSAGGILWTAQGQLLIQNSSKSMMSTTSGIFWFMLQNSLIVGNAFFYIYLYIRVGKNNCINKTDNYIIFSIFTVFGICGVFLFTLITKKQSSDYPKRSRSSVNEDSIGENSLLAKGTSDHSDSPPPENNYYRTLEQAWLSVVRAVKLVFTKDMLLLSVCFIYTGYALNFWSGVYGTVIGRTGLFPRANVGLAGFFIGLGEITGGGLFGILGKYTNKFGKDPVVLLGMLVHFAAYILIYFNIPADSINSDISAVLSFGALFNPSNLYVAMLCAFLLGFGDACFNTQIYSMIGNLYPSDKLSAPAMALFKFFQSIAAMIGFVTSTFVHLQWQLLILVILGAFGTLSFASVEWRHHSRYNRYN